MFIGVEADQFRYTKGMTKAFAQTPDAPTRSFCGRCGVQLTSSSPRAPGGVLIRVGTLDDPAVYLGPQFVTWTSEMQAFHQLPPDVPAHPQFPRPKGPA